MADSLSPQVPPAPGRLYGADQRRLWRATEQLQRQRVTTPQAAPAASSGGGIVGSVRWMAWGTAATASNAVAGTQCEGDQWESEAIAGTAPTFTPDGGNLVAASEGWYSVVASLRVSFGTPPTHARISADSSSHQALAYPEHYPRWIEPVYIGAVWRAVNFGPVYLNAGGFLWVGMIWGTYGAASTVFVNHWNLDIVQHA